MQIRVLAFSKVSGSQKSAFLAVAIYQNFVHFKIGSCFWFKSFVSNLLRSPKSASRFLAKVLADKHFHFAKSVFSGERFFWQNQVSKIGSNFSAKVLVSLV